VQTSLIGSILSNILLVLGMSFAFGGVHFTENTFQQTAAQASGSIMMLSVVAIALPAAYQGGAVSQLFGGKEAAQPGSTEAGILFISRGTSVVLLLVYMLYLYFQLKSHAFLYEGEEGDQEEEEEPQMTPVAAVVALGIITVITSFSADYLVGAIDETANEYGIPKAFISTILLPIIGNAAEHTTSCLMAYKGKMEIAIGVSVGSSIQIAMGLLPSLIIVAWIIGQPLTLYFQTFETVSKKMDMGGRTLIQRHSAHLTTRCLTSPRTGRPRLCCHPGQLVDPRRPKQLHGRCDALQSLHRRRPLLLGVVD
jgi:Ca2+:H+ antiporter